MEFSDGVIARGRLLEVGTDAVVLQMPLYCTARGTDVQARTWRVVPGDEPGLMKVNKRLACGVMSGPIPSRPSVP
ncbi:MULTISPECIES: hypothetical protein [unclassified Pseudomonas]|uniref:hypothetical protein n=1 Tax=unclassified Pseudomonas TaxID=196821 RepID=UPI00244A310F|nr:MULTISPECIES: hypothetical protein [unclassified Pseudomonas]MDG9927375.1 hypothetical protein [Pseudomonas sp. GD04042]MDH0482444.1 hypothetical protein [Pseudomonas sp. GD04015]MDH0602796.1 hypothetical protein [Pseudomonas sp. GD03869]